MERRRRIRNTLAILLLISVDVLVAEDMRQKLMGEGSLEDLGKMEVEGKSEYLREGGVHELIQRSYELSAPFIPGQVKTTPPSKEKDRGYATSPNQFSSGSFEDNQGYLEFKNSEIVDANYKRGRKSFHFSYLKDHYDYKDSAGNFTNTYNSNEGDRYGFLHVGGKNRMSTGFVNTNWGIQTGLGLSQGKGVFLKTSEVSDVNFSLWTIPLEILLSLELPMTKYLHLEFDGGPSGVLLIQTRSDRDGGDRDKSRRQMGYGYVLAGKLKFNVSQISKNTGFDMYKDYSISNFFMSIEGRIHNYSGFKQEGVSLSGASFGIGFIFEYL